MEISSHQVISIGGNDDSQRIIQFRLFEYRSDFADTAAQYLFFGSIDFILLLIRLKYPLQV